MHISAIFVPGEFPEVVRLHSYLLSNAMQFLFFIGTCLTGAKKITIHDVMGNLYGNVKWQSQPSLAFVSILALSAHLVLCKYTRSGLTAYLYLVSL